MAFSPNDYVCDSVWSAASVTNSAQDVSTNVNNLIDGFNITNTTGAIAYLQVFDLAATNVSLGSTVPKFFLGVNAGTSMQIFFPKPIKMTTGFSIASTTTSTGSTGAIQGVTTFFGSAPA